jgi:hypothetical protein
MPIGNPQLTNIDTNIRTRLGDEQTARPKQAPLNKNIQIEKKNIIIIIIKKHNKKTLIKFR